MTNQIKAAILILITVVAAYVVGSMSASRDLDEFIKDYDDVKVQVEDLRKHSEEQDKIIDSLDTEIEKKDGEISESKTTIARLSGERVQLSSQLSDLRGSLNTSVNCVDSLTVTTEIVTNLETQLAKADSTNEENQFIIGNQFQQLTMTRAQLLSATTTKDSLFRIVQTLPESPDNPDKIFGFIPKPSRPVVFVGGLVIGSYVTYRIYEQTRDR